MPTFAVKIYETVIHMVDVEAADSSDAYNKAYEIVTNGQQDEYDTEAEGFTGDYSVVQISD
jgi:hypothetical protein